MLGTVISVFGPGLTSRVWPLLSLASVSVALPVLPSGVAVQVALIRSALSRLGATFSGVGSTSTSATSPVADDSPVVGSPTVSARRMPVSSRPGTSAATVSSSCRVPSAGSSTVGVGARMGSPANSIEAPNALPLTVKFPPGSCAAAGEAATSARLAVKPAARTRTLRVVAIKAPSVTRGDGFGIADGVRDPLDS